jgi:soluble lytic murein transglycosylase-like protein
MGDLTGQIDRATQAIAKLSEQDAPERVGEWRSMAQAYEVIPPEGMTLEEVPEVGMKSMILEAMTANRDRLMRMRESQAARIEGIERTGASTRNTYGDRGWTYYGGNQTGASGGYSADQQSGFEAMWESATPGERNEMRRRYQAGESKEQIMSTVAPPEQSVAPPVQESGPMSVPASPLPGLGGEGYTPAPQPQRLEETPTFSDETTVTGSSPFLGKLASRRPIPDPAAMQGVDVTRLPGGGPMQNYTGGRDQGVTTESLPFGYSAPEPTSEILLKRPARFWGDLASRGIEAIGSAGEAVGDFLRGGKPEGMSYREYEMMLQQQAARPGDPSFMGPLQPPRERFPVTAENLGISGGPQPMPSGEQMLQNVGEFMDPLTSRIPTQDEIWTGTVGQNPAILGPGRTPRHTPLTQPQQGGAVDVPIVSEGVGLLSGVNVDRPAPPTAASPPGTGDVGLLRGQNAYQPADSPPVPADQQALITDPAAVSQVGAEQTPSGMLTQLLQQLINSGRVGEPALDEAVNAPRQILASQTQRFTPDVYDKQSFAETTGPPREFGVDPALMDAIRGVTIEGNPVVRDDWEPFIQEAAQATGLDPMMIASVIGQESSFKDDQVSKAGAVGPMQVMEGAAQDVGVPWELVKVSDRWNIMAGAMYLKHLLDNQAQGDIGKALTMYNYGPSWWDTPNPKTGMTRDYLGNKEAREYSPGVMDWARRISGTGGG